MKALLLIAQSLDVGRIHTIFALVYTVIFKLHLSVGIKVIAWIILAIILTSSCMLASLPYSGSEKHEDASNSETFHATSSSGNAGTSARKLSSVLVGVHPGGCVSSMDVTELYRTAPDHGLFSHVMKDMGLIQSNAT